MALCGAVPSLFVSLTPSDDDPTQGLASIDPEANVSDCVVLPKQSAAAPCSVGCAIAEDYGSDTACLTPTREQSPTPTPSVASNDFIEEVEISDTPRTNLQGRVVIPRPRHHVQFAEVSTELKKRDLGSEKENTQPPRRDTGTGPVPPLEWDQTSTSSSREDLSVEDMRSSLRKSGTYLYHGEQNDPETQDEANTTINSDFSEDRKVNSNTNHNNLLFDGMNDEIDSSALSRLEMKANAYNSHIAAVLRDAAKGDGPSRQRRDPNRSSTPLKPKLTHYSSADEILQRFSQKARRSDDRQSEDSTEDIEASYLQMPSRKSASPPQRSTKSAEVEFLRQENEMLKQQLSYAESLLNDKVNSLTISLEEGKKSWENAKKENIELRAKAELDALKMQRMEDRIRTLEAALTHGNIDDPRNSHEGQNRDAEYRHSLGLAPYSPADSSHSRLSGGASLDLQLAREAAEIPPANAAYARYKNSTPSHSSTSDLRFPKQYRSTGDLHSSLAWPGSRQASSSGHDADYGAFAQRPSNLKQSPARHASSMQKVYWVDDPGRGDDIPKRSHDERTHFEPPKVHPMIVKMATKRKRNERSRTLGPNDLSRSRSPDRQSRSNPTANDGSRRSQDDARGKPAWLQRILSLKKSSGVSRSDENSRPPPPPGRTPSRQSDYGAGRTSEHDGSSENGDYGAMERAAHFGDRRRQLSGGSDGRPPPAVLIENIRARMRDFNATPTPQAPTPPPNHADALDGRTSVELPRQRHAVPDHGLPPRPASSMELGRYHHAEPKFQDPHQMDEDQALKLRVNSMLEREASRKGSVDADSEPGLRPPLHGPVRAIHAFSNSESGLDLPPRPATAEPKVPPLDLSKLNAEKIAQGNGLPTEMRNYADELIKKYMTSLAPNPE